MSPWELVPGRLYHNRQDPDPEGEAGKWHGWKEVFPAMSFVTLVNGSGRRRFVMQAFGIGGDGTLLHNLMESDGTWHSWQGPFQGAPKLRLVEARYGAPGNLEVLAIGASDGTLYHNWQSADDELWHEWVPDFRGVPKLQSVTSARGAKGRFEVFGIGLDGTLYHISQDSNEWYAWEGNFQRAPRVSAVVAAFGPAKHLEVFAIGADDGTLYHNWQNESGDWDTWVPNFNGAPKVKAVTAALGQGPLLHVLVITRDDSSVAHIRQDANQWYPWDVEFLGGPRAGFLTAAEGLNGQVEVFAIAPDHRLLRTWRSHFQEEDQSWHPWQRNFRNAPGAGFVAANTGGGSALAVSEHLEVFLISPPFDR